MILSSTVRAPRHWYSPKCRGDSDKGEALLASSQRWVRRHRDAGQVSSLCPKLHPYFSVEQTVYENSVCVVLTSCRTALLPKTVSFLFIFTSALLIAVSFPEFLEVCYTFSTNTRKQKNQNNPATFMTFILEYKVQSKIVFKRYLSEK